MWCGNATFFCTQSFFRYYSFKNPVAAADVVNAVNALLEMGGDHSLDLIDVSAPADSTDGGEAVALNEEVGDATAPADMVYSVFI